MISMVQLTPDQAADLWNEWREQICQVLELEPNGPEASRVLEALVNELLQAWALERDGRALGVLLTATIFEVSGMFPSLLIYALVAPGAQLSYEDLVEIRRHLEAYAKNRGVRYITAYVEDERVETLVQRMGGIFAYKVYVKEVS